jgi:hypothetical protein
MGGVIGQDDDRYDVASTGGIDVRLRQADRLKSQWGMSPRTSQDWVS